MGLFYSLETERPIPITLFFLEVVAKLSEGDPNAGASDLVSKALLKSGLTQKPTRDQIEYALLRLQELSQNIANETHGRGKDPGKGLGTDLMKWLSLLRTEEMCLLLAKFDSFEARKIYKEWDRDEVTEAFRVYLSYEREKMQASFEAVLYGFGGGYKEDRGVSSTGSSNVEVYDLTKDNPDGLEELKKALRGF